MSLDASSKQNKSAKVVIVGGGVIGLSIARELALRDVCDVAVIDRAEFGLEASWAAGGILAPQVEADSSDEFFRLACASRDLYPAFAAALEEETGVDVELDQTGTLYVAFREDEEDKLRSILAWQTDQGFKVEWLTGADARRLEPSLSSNTRCALRFPNDWQVENRKLIQALIKSNKKLGLKLIAHCEATSLHIEAGRVTGVETSSGYVGASTVVLTAGAWSSLIGGVAATEIEVEPVRGQMLCFKPEPAVARHVIYSARGYLVPRRDGRLLAGSTSERVGFEKRVTDEAVESIKSMAFEIVPDLKSLPIVDSWAGFRPCTPDALPVLGEDPNIHGLFYATGHYRNGILLAPITAKMVTDAVMDGPMEEDVSAFRPGRFAGSIHFV